MIKGIKWIRVTLQTSEFTSQLPAAKAINNNNLLH